MTPLPVVQVGAIASHGDLFRCEPYHVNLTARSCLARQGATYEAGRNKHVGPKLKTAHPACASCPLGAQVRERLKGVADTAAPLAVAVKPPPARIPEEPPPVSMVVRIERPRLADLVDDDEPEAPVAVAVGEPPARARATTLPPPAFAAPVAVADAPRAPLPVVVKALAAARRELALRPRRAAAPPRPSPALERAVRSGLRRLARELLQVLARAVLAAAGVAPRRA